MSKLGGMLGRFTGGGAKPPASEPDPVRPTQRGGATQRRQPQGPAQSATELVSQLAGQTVVPPTVRTQGRASQRLAPPKTERAPEPEYYDPMPASGKGWLTAISVKKAFGKRQVVRGVSLAVRQGEAVGLLGPNGAGKTTCFYMVTGLIPADSGKILIDGNDVTGLPMYRRARLGIGYLPQEASIFRGLTVEQNIMAVLELVEPSKKKRNEQLDALLDEFRITKLRKSPSIALSGGERRRCEIARALASRPSFILLDEPFAGIDPIAVGDIQVLVRHLTDRGIGVLITDHNVRETLSLIDRAYIIYDGQVLMQGTPDEVIAHPEVRKRYLGDMTL